MNSSLSKSDRYKAYEFKKLCHLLGFNRTEMTKLLSTIDSNYKEWTEDKLDSKGNPKKYLDGTVKQRTFRNPSTFLKVVQKRIKRNVLDKVKFPDCIHGGVKKRSNITNAKQHQGKKYIFETDLQEFYPNISMRRVYDAFLSLGYSTHISHWLTTLTTRKNELPQGSPTSTALANLVFIQTDFALLKICKRHEITYTRYVDDLTFSAQADFGKVVQEILDTVIEGGFKLSRRKTKYEGHQSVTGIPIFLNKIDAPNHILDKAIAELDSGADRTPYTNYVNNIRKTNRKKEKPATNKSIAASGAGH